MNDGIARCFGEDLAEKEKSAPMGVRIWNDRKEKPCKSMLAPERVERQAFHAREEEGFSLGDYCLRKYSIHYILGIVKRLWQDIAKNYKILPVMKPDSCL